MLKTKIVLNARPAIEKTATPTIISTSVQAANRLAKGLINIILDPISRNECGSSSRVWNAAIRPVHRHVHQHQDCVDGRTADVRGASALNSSVIRDALLSGRRLWIVNSSEGRRNETVRV